MIILAPPRTDELIERHQFYATITGHTVRNVQDIDGIGKKIIVFNENFDIVRDEVKATSTRNRTIITAAIVIWALISSVIGIYIQRGMAGADQLLSQVELLSKKSLLMETIIEQRKEMPGQIDALKRSVNEHQRLLDEISLKLEKK